MASNRVYSVLLAASIGLVSACVSQPVATVAPEGTFAEKKFQRAAKAYRVYLHEGQRVYCRKERPITSSIAQLQCVTEAQLRQQVEAFSKTRNAVARPQTPGTGQGGIGG